MDGVAEQDGLAVVRAHSVEHIKGPGDDDARRLEPREPFALRRAGDGWLITDYVFDIAP